MSSDLTPAEMDEKFDSFKISEQAQRVVDLIQENALNHDSGFSVQVLSDSLKRFEFGQTDARTATSNKTTAILGVVSQTVYEHALLQDDGTYKSDDDMNDDDMQKQASARDDLKAISKAVYDDPVANPLRRELGGSFDIDRARIDLIQGIPLKPSVFAEGIPTKDQDQILEAMSELPIHTQQLAAQGLKQAAQDAKHNKSFGGQKTASTNYVKSVISDQLTGFDNFERSNGRDAHAPSFSGAFNNALYDAKGRQAHALKQDNPDLASNKPPVLITADLNDSFATAMSNGINKDIAQIHRRAQEPHTIRGDHQMSYDIEQVLSNAVDLSETLQKSLENPKRDKAGDYQAVKAFDDIKSIADNMREIASEMPDRNYPLEVAARATKQAVEDNSPSTDLIQEARNNHTQSLIKAHEIADNLSQSQPEPATNSPSMRPR